MDRRSTSGGIARSALAGVALAGPVAGLVLLVGTQPVQAHERRKTTVVIDLSAQRLRVFRSGQVVLATRVSAGSGRRYCVGGRCATATTPVGHFRVWRKVKAWHESLLGLMYKPIYFYRGYSIHGSLSVPHHPDSHGCVRVPIEVGEKLSALLHVGDRVIVRR
ncbi:L,D-transpeptidase [Actinomadura barringtoniae]|uniref:L,D-transpeptidase n=1 Tax=Actinomadura barringtoniae TaxID=1427535 RepID=A0A939PN54_9ACTN|nr:L,D-transpeptidase [Actinomadura barringtoniae]MBO2451636.1 L,D-transpeptidase [Actinomadura barringtoniae]